MACHVLCMEDSIKTVTLTIKAIKETYLQKLIPNLLGLHTIRHAASLHCFPDISPDSTQCICVCSCFVVCPDDNFACDNAVCIHESWECDGLDDCGDNSDEDDCTGLLFGI